jgi:hypothetical protein
MLEIVQNCEIGRPHGWEPCEEKQPEQGLNEKAVEARTGQCLIRLIQGTS